MSASPPAAPARDEAHSDEAAPSTATELDWIQLRLRERLEQLEITTVDQLRAQAGCPHRRRSLASELDVPTTTVLQWAAITSLLRMPELGLNMASRLVGAGIDGLPCLADQRPELLRARLHQRQPRLDLPSLEELQQLCAAAGTFDRAVWY